MSERPSPWWTTVDHNAAAAARRDDAETRARQLIDEAVWALNAATALLFDAGRGSLAQRLRSAAARASDVSSATDE